MTVKELHTFTDAELSIIENALSVAAEEWTKTGDVLRREGASILPEVFDRRSSDARALQLKIEASR